MRGRFKIRIGEASFRCEAGGFAYLPKQIPHAFLNLADEPGEIVVVYTPGGTHSFFEENGPLTLNGSPDPKVLALIFEKHQMSLLGPPLQPDTE
jgi:uncharacterized RmlC-like cupin family protein